VQLVQGDLTDRNSLAAAIDGCWGVFAVTNFYDSVLPPQTIIVMSLGSLMSA
jgi:uncharacterized protein YbjT (DUF2867 family)